MDVLNNKYNIELEILTPLSIGAGAEKDYVRGSDFVLENGRAYFINLKKVARLGIDINLLSSYFTQKDESGVRRLIGNRLLEVSDFVQDYPIDSDNDIKSFVRNQLSDNPIISGSSLKGALRSILFQYLGASSRDGREVLGNSVDGDDLGRFIKISDAEFDELKLVNTKIFNLQKKTHWIGGWKHGQQETGSDFKPTGFNTIYECLIPGAVSYSSIMLTKQVFDLFEKYAKDKYGNKLHHVKYQEKGKILSDLQFLFGIINDHTIDYLQKEREFFQKYSADKTDAVIDGIDAILDMMPADNNSCILKMSAGSGFHSITGDWQFDDFSEGVFDRKRADKKSLFIAGKVLPKSRKIAIDGDNFSLMGFVKLTIVSAEEKNRKLEKIRQEKERLENERLEKIRLEREAFERAEQERLENLRKQEEERLKAAAELKAKIEKYDSLIEEASNLRADNKIENALSKLKEAKECYPEGVRHNDLINELEIILNKSKRLASGLSFLLETKVGSTELKLSELSNGIKRVMDFLKKNKEYQIYDSDKDSVGNWLKLLPKPTKKADIKEYSDINSKSWKTISDLFGEAKAKEWFGELSK